MVPYINYSANFLFKTSKLVNLNYIVSGYHLARSIADYTKTRPENFHLKEKIDKVVRVCEGITFAFGLRSLTMALERRFPVVSQYFPSRDDYLVPFILLAVTLSWMGVAYSICTVFNRYMHSGNGQPTQSVQQFQNNDQVKIEFDYPKYQKLQQCLYVSDIMVNVALAYFSVQSKILGMVNIASLSYSFYQSSYKRWICLTHSFKQPNIEGAIGGIALSNLITKIKAEYYFPVIRNNEKKNCTICIEGEEANEPTPEMHFCRNHVFHINCISRHIQRCSGNLINDLDIEGRTIHIRNGLKSRIEYEASIPQTNLPNCPNCRGNPVSQELYLELTESNRYKISGCATGGIHTTNKIVFKQPIPEEDDDIDDNDLEELIAIPEEWQ